MNYGICQLVRIVDMNNELIREELFDHGLLDTPAGLSFGCTVITHQLGLRQFEIVYDKRFESVRSKIIDLEFSLITKPPLVKAYLEPIELIVGQHDVGEATE